MKKFEHVYQEAEQIKRFLLGEMSEAEQAKLNERLAASPELRKVVEQLQEESHLKGAFDEYKSYSSKKAYQDFLQCTATAPKVAAPKHRTFSMRWLIAAAVVVMAIGLSFYVVNQVLTSEGEKVLIQPGTQQAQLTLPDGSVIDMNKHEVEVMVDGVQVKYQEGVLSYQIKEELPEENQSSSTAEEAKETVSQKTEQQAMQSNELATPRGGENTVILSDGTTVHLNAGSKLTYPVRFAGKRRLVALEGEAYFDVAADAKRPFVVRTHLGEITVLGTAFNVNAYTDSPVCYTTLVRGKVRVDAGNKQTVTLLPGEQAMLTASHMEKREVNLEEYVGWVNGKYVFNDRPLGEIMKVFERWYNIRVHYEIPAMKNITYSGSLNRDATINTFLDALELTGDLAYEIRNKNEIYIRQGEYW